MKADILLSDLVSNVRCLTFAQACKFYFENNADEARRFLLRIEKDEFIKISTEFVRRREINSPLATVYPGEPLPSSHRLSYLANKLWAEVPEAMVTIHATAKLSAVYGGEYRPVAVGHLSHEIALSQVYWLKKAHSLELKWELVNQGAAQGSVPDAYCAGAAIEIIGRYSADLVASKLAISSECPIELW